MSGEGIEGEGEVEAAHCCGLYGAAAKGGGVRALPRRRAAMARGEGGSGWGVPVRRRRRGLGHNRAGKAGRGMGKAGLGLGFGFGKIWPNFEIGFEF